MSVNTRLHVGDIITLRQRSVTSWHYDIINMSNSYCSTGQFLKTGHVEYIGVLQTPTKISLSIFRRPLFKVIKLIQVIWHILHELIFRKKYRHTTIGYNRQKKLRIIMSRNWKSIWKRLTLQESISKRCRRNMRYERLIFSHGWNWCAFKK